MISEKSNCVYSSFPSPPLPAAFDTSCFSGDYVTGEKMGDPYFTKLFDLRNDDAKQRKNDGKAPVNGKKMTPRGSNDGCESVVNDTRTNKGNVGSSCEPLTNDGAVR